MNHCITVCTSCRNKGAEDRPGHVLIERLRHALSVAGNTLPEVFSVNGAACMAGCDHPCTVAFHGPDKATYLFGDIDVDADLNDLLSFAKQYAYLRDGWCSPVDRPGKLRKSTLARVPTLPGTSLS